ncbi:hypothetical protein BIY24_02965 [Halobacteriovorax marinus]|uniref:Response regulatory domain-containing protein n=1 Tax=Halobacteriovorax marinus (strain ATCC BAA-682 / DSM 15412 / SJ) TaxID=862908 RepID=E1X530_HALMS|nr:hypothetical protein [Halobacteriovorax marinus]ATH06932.1 hypothetical protein BIY24_02965 [Halobacteriovorax marinus]CBW25501.1 hypothetical protein BMS_0593 [Halobacteriovorax marinus SJ]
MKKLYYIEQESFLRDLLETMCRQNEGFEAYSAAEGSDNLYFFKDLSPDFILIDWSTVESYQEKLLTDLAEVAQIPVGVTKEPSQQIPDSWQERAELVIDKPLEVKTILRKIFP